MKTYHLEAVELLLNLLCKHWGESVAGGDFATAVIIRGRPGIVELNAWAEAYIPKASIGSIGQTPCAWTHDTGWTTKVVITIDRDLTCLVIVGRVGYTRFRGLIRMVKVGGAGNW